MKKKNVTSIKIKDDSLPYPYSLFRLRKLACLDIGSAVQFVKYPMQYALS